MEETVSRGVPSDHLAARGADVDFQIWIAQGEQPLIQRVVLTYKLEEGAPQFWAEFSDWNFNPAVPASKFEFQPPADAQAHSVSGQLRRDRPHEAGAGGADRRNAMNSRRSIQLIALVSAVLLVAASFYEAEARGGRGGGGRGGGGGYSRGGAAAGGEFFVARRRGGACQWGWPASATSFSTAHPVAGESANTADRAISRTASRSRIAISKAGRIMPTTLAKTDRTTTTMKLTTTGIVAATMTLGRRRGAGGRRGRRRRCGGGG